MSRTEELIAKAQQGDREASEALVEENSGLIWSVARRFLGRGTEGRFAGFSGTTGRSRCPAA